MNQKHYFRFLLAFAVGILVSLNTFAQDITVKGHVKDTSGEPVIMGTVQQKGTSRGCHTDLSGNFTLSVPRGATLVFSYMGYVTQELEAQPNMTVIMAEDAKMLEETVIIAYGKVKKNDATGALTAIKPDEISKGITTSAQDMLVGKVAGVSVIGDGSPGGQASIRIRGGSSLSANNDPLIVIDGLAMDGNGVQGLSNALAMVNPEDIESFTVLKDASSTAIYGSRASNGVIIITTKKGRKGAKPQISYHGNISLGTIRKKYEVLDANEYRDYVVNILGMDDSKLGDANTNWQDKIYRTAISHDHQVGITGSFKNLPYRASVGFTDNQGIVKTTDFKRFTASLNLNPTLLDEHLAINFNAKYMHSNNHYTDVGAAIGNALNADPTHPVYDNTYHEFGGFWQNPQSASYSDPNWKYTTNTNTPQNPYASIKLRNDRAHTDVLIGSMDFDYKIHGFEDMHIHASVGADYSEGRQLNDVSPYSYSNNYFGWSGVNQSYKYVLQGNIYAQYIHNFNDVHNLDVMAGVEKQHFHRIYYSYGQGFDKYLFEQEGDYEAAVKDPSERKMNEHIYRNSLDSYFGRLNYGLLDRYLLTFTMRWDGSSRFAKGNKWGTFPSLGLAWKINEEAFLKNATALDELKLRLGWGITGQQNIGWDFYYLPRYVVGNSYAQYTLGDETIPMIRPEMYNTDLKWEKTTTWNVGLDWSFLNGKIDGAIDWYSRKTDDLISTVSIASGLGFGNYKTMNIGSLKNTGLEIMINAHPVTTKDFSWTVNYNFTYNKNKITKLTTGSDFALTGGTVSAGLSNQVQVNKVGYAANSFYVYQQVYDQNGKPIEGLFVDRNADGVINADDKYVYKKPSADVTMGLTNKFIYKNWDFSFTLRTSFNNYLYYDFLSGHANVSTSGVYSNGAFNNTTAEAVRLGFQGKTDYYMSDYFVRNASFLRCDNINLGYSFNHLFSTNSYNGVGGRVYVLVQNPFVITKYDGLDPELTHGTGVDRSIYPRPRTYMLGLSLNF